MVVKSFITLADRVEAVDTCPELWLVDLGRVLPHLSECEAMLMIDYDLLDSELQIHIQLTNTKINIIITDAD